MGTVLGQIDWVWGLTGFVMGAVALGVFGWALWWDRGRGRKRCPKCWYDMSGATARGAQAGYVCPECGKRVASEVQLFRTRRRWRYSMGAIAMLCVSLQTALMGTPGRGGWVAYVPTVVMIGLVQDFRTPGPITTVLLERLHEGVVMPWDRTLAAEREMSLADAQWQDTLKARGRWPVDQPLRVMFTPGAETYSTFESRQCAVRCLQYPDVKEATEEFARPRILGCFVLDPLSHWLELPPPRLGFNEYEFEVKISGETMSHRTRRFHATVEGVASLNEVTPRGADSSLDRNFAASLRWQVSWYEGRAYVEIRPRAGQAWPGPVVRTFEAELWRGGTLLGHDTIGEYTEETARIAVDAPLDKDGRLTVFNFDGVMLRFRPTQVKALKLQFRDESWNGSVEMPLRDVALVTFEFEGTGLAIPKDVQAIPFDAHDRQELTKGWKPAAP